MQNFAVHSSSATGPVVLVDLQFKKFNYCRPFLAESITFRMKIRFWKVWEMQSALYCGECDYRRQNQPDTLYQLPATRTLMPVEPAILCGWLCKSFALKALHQRLCIKSFASKQSQAALCWFRSAAVVRDLPAAGSGAGRFADFGERQSRSWDDILKPIISAWYRVTEWSPLSWIGLEFSRWIRSVRAPKKLASWRVIF